MISPEALRSFSDLSALAVVAIPFAAVLLTIPKESTVKRLLTKRDGRSYPAGESNAIATQSIDPDSSMTTVIIPSGAEVDVEIFTDNSAGKFLKTFHIYDHRRRDPTDKYPGCAGIAVDKFGTTLSEDGQSEEIPLGIIATYRHNDKEKQIR